ncbi:MAG: outer membrane beta-barrel protein [Hyphomonadaceae bacterium]|nr:outer membrane beta-barrel protein [Hyphomonadaceae bacterium]
MSLLLAMAPMHAVAQEISRERDPNAAVSVTERARPEYDPLGMRLGGFDLNASVGVGVTSTDNVFASETDAQDDFVTYVRPDISLRSHWSRHALGFRAGGYSDSHADFSQDDVTDYYLGADGRLDILTRSEVGGGVSTNRVHEMRTDPDTPLGIAEPVEYTRDNVYVYGSHSFNRLRLTARVERNTYDYEDTPLIGGGVLDQDYRDHDETAESLRAEFALTPRWAALAEVSVNQREYDSDPTRDSDGSFVGLGVAFDVTNLLQGNILVTQYEQDYDDPNIGTVEGTGFIGHAEWFPTQLTTVNVDAARTAEDSAFVGASYIETHVSARVDHELRRNIVLSAGARLENRDYEGFEREDDLVGVDVGATYRANRRVNFNANYGYRQNDSSFPGEDFEENRFTLGVSFHL